MSSQKRFTLQSLLRTTPNRSNKNKGLLFLATICISITGVLAAPIIVNVLELGRGQADKSGCIDSVQADFTYSISSSDTLVTAINLSNLGQNCQGKILNVVLKNSLGVELFSTESNLGAGSAATMNVGTSVSSSEVVSIEYSLRDS